MKHLFPRQSLPSRAFTLIELLVVIAVIGILAGLLFTAMPAVTGARMKSVARAELTQLSTAIEAYKAKYNSYPPANPASGLTNNPLYFELVGTTFNGSTYRTLDESYSAASGITNGFKIAGLVNSASSAGGDDNQAAVIPFLKDLKPTQLATNNSNARILVCSADGTPWSYNSANPTNNPGSFDLWVDLVIGGKTNRIANWNR